MPVSYWLYLNEMRNNNINILESGSRYLTWGHTKKPHTMCLSWISLAINRLS